MNSNFSNDLIEAGFMPFEIEKMSKEELISEDTFNYLLTLNNKFEKEKVIMQLEERAKEKGCLTNFRNILKQYNKELNIKQNEKLKHNEVADKILEENKIAIYDNNLYMYVNGIYTDDTRTIERKIIDIYPEADSHFRGEVCKNLFLKSEPTKIVKESGIINFKNGLYNIKEKKLYVHTPSFFSINQINVNFNENAKKVKAVDDFLDKISTHNQKRKQTILEMIGYCMTTSINLQKSFILYGETARNGKSTLCNVITQLIGQKNVSNISLKDMNKNAFATSVIKGKILNIGSEMSEEFLSDTSIFKMFSTGDYLTVEEKFKSKQTISPYAKFIFNANELPIVADKTNAFYRRLQIIPLETSFSESDSKLFDINEILTNASLEYLAKLSVDAYSSMGEHFSNFEESEKETNKYKISSNSVLSFMQDTESNILYDKKEPHTAKDVFDSYKEYCIANQYKFWGRNKFYAEIEKNNFVIVRNISHQKHYSLNMQK